MKRLVIGASVVATVLAGAMPAAAQQAPLPLFSELKPWDPAYTAPRTAWGQPDLQGTWSTAALTTLTRNAQNGTQGMGLVIPQEKIDEITENSYYNVRLRNDNQRTPETAGAGDGKGGGDVKGYNNFWIDPGSEYAKVNGEYRSSWIVSPDNGQIPFNRAGNAAAGSRMTQARSSQNTGPEIRTLGDRCLVSFANQGGPPITNAMYNNHVQIVQTPDHVMLQIEMNHDARIIRLTKDADEEKELPANIQPWFGDSIGWWEGDTLVVETKNLHRLQARGRIPLSAEGKVVERFRRVSDVEIDYQYDVIDPVSYTQTWKGQMPMRLSREPIYEYACHEGNHALPGILVGMALELDTALEADGE
ncbi:MAG: hypothetical protein RIR33_2294 [Pseudomonadota bacterium]|jgi:hypothetical protein